MDFAHNLSCFSTKISENSKKKNWGAAASTGTKITAGIELFILDLIF